jgi:hypothetical protein
MDIDLGTIIIGIICTAICVIPFIIMGINRKKKEQEKLQILQKIASQHNGQVNNHEFCGNFGIALDSLEGFAYFYSESQGVLTKEAIDLSQIKECSVLNTSISISKNNETQKVIEKLELCFKSANQSKGDVKWELYNRQNKPQLYGEFQAAEKWSKLINEQLAVAI